MDLTWVDTHVHIDRYESAERTALLDRAHSAGVSIIAVGVDIESSRAALAVDATAGAVVGVHPLHADGADPEALIELLAHPAVVGIGECGFDASGPPFEEQSSIFEAHARAARALDLPLVLHINGDGAFEALRARAGGLNGLAVIRHYFTGTAAQAAWHADHRHYLSFGNPLRRDPTLREIALAYPADRLLIETDSYPLPDRRTEPRDVVRVGETLALVRGWTFAETSTRLLENTRTAFPRLAL